MDFKITNFDVSTEQIYLEQTVELPIDTDYLLSDYEGDIKKVLNCEIIPFITSKQISGNSLIVEGEARINIIYSTPNGEVFCTEQELPFKKNFDSAKNLDGGYCDVYTTAVIHTCRAVTERKFSIRSSLKLDVKVTVIEKNKIISDIDCCFFEQLKGEISATIPLGKTQKTIIIDDEISLPQNSPDAKRIVRTSAVSFITDCKIVADKTIIKGNLKVALLYCTEENNFEKQYVNIPFNQIIDIPGINEFCECDAFTRVCGINISSRNSTDEETRKFILISKIEINVFARCNNKIPIIYDLYSTKYNVLPKCNEVKFSKLAKLIDECFLCKKVLTLPNGDVSNILDIWCKTDNINIKYQNNTAIIGGNVLANILYENQNGEPNFIERIIDFEFPFNFDEKLNFPICKPEIQIANCDFSFTVSGEPEIKLDLVIHAAIYDNSTYTAITDLDIDENAILNNSASLIAYYADKGENVWEIAKNFSAKLNELFKINHLTEDIIPSPKMLLIPRI